MLFSQSNNQLTMFLDKYQWFWYILYYTFRVVGTFVVSLKLTNIFTEVLATMATVIS